jgi:hypothetical protein
MKYPEAIIRARAGAIMNSRRGNFTRYMFRTTGSLALFEWGNRIPKLVLFQQQSDLLAPV